MSKKIIKNLFLLVIVLIFVSPAFAWDSVGHKLAAYIAWQQMTPATREKVIKILLSAPEDSDLSAFYPQDARSEAARQQEFFMTAAYWSDIVRDKKFENRYKYHHGTWHYLDTFWREANGKAELVTELKPDKENAVERLFFFDKVLRDNTAKDSEKAIAIAWIEHLVGDVHQPLHASGRVTDLEPKGDQGGNLFLLTPKDTPREKQENLHSFWDRIIGLSVQRKNDAPDSVYIPEIGAKIIKKYPFAKMQNRLELGKFDDWQQESFRIATTEVYPSTLIRFQTPPANYKKRAYSIAEQQIALAGYRLAATFNQIFGQ
ncbi:MAG TPA: S1/P1 nuclease [Pyrinomonadaceae bacterium]|jgi:hypothetical protein